MNIIKETENQIKEIVKLCGYEINEAKLENCKIANLGQFQVNFVFNIAKNYKISPIKVAENIQKELIKSGLFKNVNIAGAGYINLTLKDESLIDFANNVHNNLSSLLKCENKKDIFMDYGGANVAKSLHVGHLRSANLGEALKRFAKLYGYNVICDVHWGDIGRQSGMVIYEIKKRYPNLPFFDENYNSEYPTSIPVSSKDLGEIYPTATMIAKEDENVMEEVRLITHQLEMGHKGYKALWKIIKEMSIIELKSIYKRLNTQFDLWEGEEDSMPFVKELMTTLHPKKLVYQSEGALVIDVKKDDDKEEVPPLLVIKSNGATTYATRDLATIISREKRFKSDEWWYLADNRQKLYFEQVFRASYKANLIKENESFKFIGFGTMTGADGKPFKTRDGGVLNLNDLITMTKNKILLRLNETIVDENERDNISDSLAISAIKYADLIPTRTNDYVFNLDKFTDFDGRTGPYLVYSVVRANSLLKKAGVSCDEFKKITQINQFGADLLAMLATYPRELSKTIELLYPSIMAEYVYQLVTSYNKFYANCNVLNENNESLKESYIGLTQIFIQFVTQILNCMGIEIPDKM